MKSKIILILITVLFLSLPVLVFAQQFNPQVGVPESNFKAGQEVEVKPDTFAKYLIAIYEWAIRVIVVLAVVMIMVGGFMWLTAGGSSQKVNLAKKRINSAIIGLVLALSSYLLLNFINPELVSFRSLTLTNIATKNQITVEDCSSTGFQRFTSEKYFCFSIDHDSEESIIYYARDLGITRNVKDEDIGEISIVLGVDTNHQEDCDKENDYEGIDERDDFQLSDPFSNDSFVCLMDGVTDECEYCEEFSNSHSQDPYCANSSGIKIRPIFNNQDFLQGFEVNYANRTPGKASAFFTNLILRTKIPCSICCVDDSSNEANFNGLANCGEGEHEDSSACCQKEEYINLTCSDVNDYGYFAPAICKGISDCGIANCRYNTNDIGNCEAAN